MADESVIKLLAGEFDWDSSTEALARHAIWDAAKRGHRLEFICDHPAVANFRLKRNQTSGQLRMAYYGRSDEGQQRAERLTSRLGALDD